MTAHLTPDMFVAELRRTIPVLEDEAEKAMHAAVELTLQRMTELAPRGASGNLARNITHTVHRTAGGVTGLVRPRAPYARFVEEGTGTGKTIRSSTGHAYSAATGHQVTTAGELANPAGVLTAGGWGAKTPGRMLKLAVPGGPIYRRRVRGQHARRFVAITRADVEGEVETLLAAGAVHATARLFP